MKIIEGIMGMVKKQEDKNENGDSSVCQNSDEKDVRIVVPTPEVIESEFPKITEKHMAFNSICKIGDENYFRIVSSESTEIFRMNCTFHKCRFGNLNKTMSDEAKLMFSCDVPYLISEKLWHFTTRVFVTKSCRYFYQTIKPDGSFTLTITSKKLVQNFLMRCETGNRERIFDEDCDKITFVPEPVTFTIDKLTSNVEKIDIFKSIDGYEIINGEYYNKLIEVL